MSRVNRRKFLKSTLAAAATVTIAGTKSSGKVLGANEAIRIGVAGINGRGVEHIRQFAGMRDVQVTYLIDPDSRLFESRAKEVQGRGKNNPRRVQDVRRALEDRNLEAISIATPNHWHALMTMWACQANKDVYVEKPSSHNVREGRQTVEIARKHNRIVQHGTQSRTDESWRRVIEVVRSGKLGRLQVAYALCYKPRNNAMGRVTSVRRVDAPRELDFNLWLGPAPQRAYHENLVHYRWHWFWDFGNGDLGNQGVHQMDIARWGVGAALPRSVVSLGGRFGPRDEGQTANTQIALFDYGPTQLIFEVRGLSTDRFHRQDVGNIFKLEEGIIAGTTFYPRGGEKSAPLPDVEVRRGPGGANHFANFIAAVRSRRREDLNADILEGHHSSALCHLANISYRLGENVAFNPRTRAFNGNADATDALARMEDHLARTNHLKLADLRLRVGPLLRLNAKEETFNGNREANRLLARENRAPFVVNEKRG